MGTLQNLHFAFTSNYIGNDSNRQPLNEVKFNDFNTRADFINDVKQALATAKNIPEELKTIPENGLPQTNYEYGKQYAATISKPLREWIGDYVKENKIVPSLAAFIKEMQPDEKLSTKGILYIIKVDNEYTINQLVKKLETAGVEMLGKWAFERPGTAIDADGSFRGDITGHDGGTGAGMQLRLNNAAYDHLLGRIQEYERTK